MGLSTNRLDSPENLAVLFDTTIEPGWPTGEYDRGAQELFCDILEEADSAMAGWYLWYAIRKPTADQSSVLIGAGGYLGLPNESGEVEIGFSIVPKWQGQGYATEMVQALVSRAFSDPRVHTVLGQTTSRNLASCKVLTKAGFEQVNCDSEGILTFAHS